MAFEHLTGTYTYRSFLDRPTGSPDEILWAEGELFLRVEPDRSITGQLRFPADPAAPAKAILDITGQADPGGELSFSGAGRADTSVAGFRYSYHCRTGHEWDNANPAQRPALIGTVVRDADHGTATAGATASFIAVKRDFVEPREIEGVALIPEAVAMLADETHRLRHTVWHMALMRPPTGRAGGFRRIIRLRPHPINGARKRILPRRGKGRAEGSSVIRARRCLGPPLLLPAAGGIQ